MREGLEKEKERKRGMESEGEGEGVIDTQSKKRQRGIERGM